MLQNKEKLLSYFDINVFKTYSNFFRFRMENQQYLETSKSSAQSVETTTTRNTTESEDVLMVDDKFANMKPSRPTPWNRKS